LGGANNNLIRSMDYYEFPSNSFKMPLEAGLSNEDLLMENKLKDLNEAKDSISHANFNLLKTDILFKNLKTKHALIRASLYGSETKIEEKRAIARKYYTYLDTLTLRSEYLNSSQFRGFLDFYLEYLNRIITGNDIPFRYNEKSYWLAKAVINEEILKAFLYERLAFQMETPFFYNSETFQYEDFIKRYPNTPESNRLRNIYTKHYPISIGQFAPELELIDSIGRKKRLSELRSKVVIISSGTDWLYALRNEKKINRIESIRRRFGDDVVMIGNFGYLKSSPLSPYIDYYVNEDQNSQNLNCYNFLSSSQYSFIVSKSGIIINCTSLLYISEDTLSELLSEKYTILTKLKYASERYINEIVVILSVLISFTLILLLFSRIRQKRQDLIKKQLDSELKAIRSQLNPHFLFNSLNSIQNFINKSDSKTANMHLSKFSLLMRRVIELSEKESTTLKEELDFNRTFIELEQLRYGFKCKFDIDNSIDLFNTEIPSMIIQPFIENAIVHCMADLGVNGELSISVKENVNGKILIEITDNGKGFPSDTKKGFGLKSSRERIDLLNSKNREKIELYIESRATSQTNQGSTIKLIIPKKY
jgi:two-component sensor histidine kinase